VPDTLLTIQIVAPDHSVLREENVSSVIVPAADGYMGILPRHAPLMAELGVGQIEIRSADGPIARVATSGGFVMVERNQVSILADTAELAQDIDVRRAEESRQRAEHRLAEHASGMDVARAQAALVRAVNRLRVARRT